MYAFSGNPFCSKHPKYSLALQLFSGMSAVHITYVVNNLHVKMSCNKKAVGTRQICLNLNLQGSSKEGKENRPRASRPKGEKRAKRSSKAAVIDLDDVSNLFAPDLLYQCPWTWKCCMGVLANIVRPAEATDICPRDIS